jgi:hypothetical protein
MAVDWDTLVIGPTIACFGEPVSYQAANATFPIMGVFDEAFKELTPLGAGEVTFSDVSLGSLVTTERPVLGVQLSQFPLASPPTQADLLVARGACYIVKEVRLDGHGGAKLLLNQIQGP